MSSRTANSVDRSLNLVLVSTESLLCVDRTAVFRSLSTKAAFFMDRIHGESEFELRLPHKRQSGHADSHRRRKN